MATTNQPLTEEQKKTRNKEYLERYRARQKYHYESLVKQNSIKAGGQNLTEAMLKERFPDVTGTTPWNIDLTQHPLKWRRQGIPTNAPKNIPNAFPQAPGRTFVDPRMLFDSTLFEAMTDEQSEYFEREEHWKTPGPEALDDTNLTEGTYLIHINRGEKLLNNPPTKRPTYPRTDGKTITWGDPRLDTPYTQHCGDYLYPHTNHTDALNHYYKLLPTLTNLNEEIRLYKITKTINLGQARQHLNTDQPLTETDHGAQTIEIHGTGQLGNPNTPRIPQTHHTQEPEPETTTETDTKNYQTWEKTTTEREKINNTRATALNKIRQTLYNPNTHLTRALHHEQTHDPEAAEATQHLLNHGTPEEKASTLYATYMENPTDAETTLRATNIITPYETYTALASHTDLTWSMVKAAKRRNKEMHQAGYEELRDWGSVTYVKHLSPENRAYAEKNLTGAYESFGAHQSAEMLVMLHDTDYEPYLNPTLDGDQGGYDWNTINLKDYKAGFLPVFGDNLPEGVIVPSRDRIEYLALLLTYGAITPEELSARVQENSYVADSLDKDLFTSNGAPLLLTKDTWSYDAYPTAPPEATRYALEGKEYFSSEEEENAYYASDDTYLIVNESLIGENTAPWGEWRRSDWEKYVDQQPDNWCVINREVLESLLEVETKAILPEILAYGETRSAQ